MSWRWVAGLRHGQAQAGGDELFLQGRDEYLKGNWFEAETILGRILDQNVLDSEARLLRANLLFHTARRKEAIGELDRLSRMDSGQIWWLEIARLRSRLKDADESRLAAETAESDDNSQQKSQHGPVAKAA